MHALHAQARNDPDNWDRYIDDAVIAYNSTKHSVAGFEPNRLMLSRNIKMPEDLQVPHDPLYLPQYVNKYVQGENERNALLLCAGESGYSVLPRP